MKDLLSLRVHTGLTESNCETDLTQMSSQGETSRKTLKSMATFATKGSRLERGLDHPRIGSTLPIAQVWIAPREGNMTEKPGVEDKRSLN